MKKLLFILLGFSAFTVNAQVLDHFSEPTSKWYVVKTKQFGPPELILVEQNTTVYGFIGDTIIDSDVWMKMYSTMDENFQEDLFFEGYIHSDSGVVRIINTLQVEDTLYNYNLNQGDSIYYEFLYPDSSYIFLETISDTLLSGQSHTVFSFSEPQEEINYADSDEKWIEGVGSIHGPLHPIRPRMYLTTGIDSTVVSCLESNSLSYYTNSGFDSCYNYSTTSFLSNDALSPSCFNVSPNPFTEELTVNLNFPNLELLELRSLNGQVVFSSNEFNESISIPTNHLPVGMYFLTILTSSESHSVKLVK